jgi:hypothetical protein
MEKIEKLIDEIGLDKIKDYLTNRKVDISKEIKEFILNEIQSCKIEFCDDGYYLVKDDYKLFLCDFKYGYFSYNYNKIYLVLIEKYKTNYDEINNICKGILVDYLKYDRLTSFTLINSVTIALVDYLKYDRLTSGGADEFVVDELVDYLKYVRLTSCNYFPNNDLTSSPELPESLTELCCGDNDLTSLPELPVSLKELDCYDNDLTSFPMLHIG